MRQFLGVALPEVLRQELARLEERLAPGSRGWRWVRPASVHLTLRFLGEVDAGLDRAGRQAWSRASSAVAPFRYRLNGLGCFPETGRPRILWIGVEESAPGGRLTSLAERLEHAAREIGFEPEHRPFTPHLTVARASRDGRCVGPAAREFAPAFEVRVDAVALFHSELRTTGPRYTCLAEFPLEG